MKRLYRYIALSLTLCPLLLSAGLDLPVKNINGKQYYYYVVKKGDTLYSLASRFNITRNDIVSNNPGAADMVRTGQTLYFPVDKYGDGKHVAVAPVTTAEDHVTQDDVVIHRVAKGETLYGISRSYGITVESIIALNPGSEAGVKAGSTLRIPTAASAGDSDVVTDVETVAETEQPAASGAIVAADETQSEAVAEEPGTETFNATDAEAQEEDYEGNSEDSVIVRNGQVGPASIAVLLPFMLESETPGRQAMLYTDFYKGLLVAADSLSDRGDSIRIYAYDTMNDPGRVRALLEDTLVSGASVIIAPSEETQMAEIFGAVNPEKTKVINVFNVRDSSYVSTPASVQTNIPHRRMYDHARQAIEFYFPDFIPVILRNESGRSDKAEFVAYLTEAYRAKGVEPVEIVYDGALLASQLQDIPDNGSRYLLIPVSGSLAEFNKFSHAVSSARSAASDPSVYTVFGYPDWTAFRNDAEQMLHSLNATVYSRFYYDDNGLDATGLNAAFERWFGSRAIEVVPHHGMLGFDVGNLIIRNIRKNDGYFNPENAEYEGGQSSFRFVPAGDGQGGWFNDDIYLLRFNEGDGRVERLSL